MNNFIYNKREYTVYVKKVQFNSEYQHTFDKNYSFQFQTEQMVSKVLNTH